MSTPTGTTQSPVVNYDAMLAGFKADAIKLGLTDSDAEVFATAKVRTVKADARKDERAAERKAAEANGEKRTNAPRIFLDIIGKSLRDAAARYEGNASELADYLLDLAGNIDDATEGDTTQQAADFRVVGRSIGRLVKPADVKPATVKS